MSTPGGWVLRRPLPEDHARVVAVVDEWWDGRPMAAMLPRLYFEHFAGTSLVAESRSGDLLGFLVGFASADVPDEGYVHFVGVAPSARGDGLGRLLHDRFATEMALGGRRTVRCVTSVVNEPSVAFHTAIGFGVDGERDGLVLMSRSSSVLWESVAVADPREAAWPVPVWPPPEGTVLRGRYVELAASDPDRDGEELFAALDHDAVWAHVAGRPADAAGMRALIEGKRADPAWFPWTVRLRVPLGDRAAGEVVGTTSYLEAAPGDARVEIGSTTYAPDVWGTVVNPECKLLLMAWAFEVGGMGRVQLKTDIRNHRSQAAIRRLGARYEGVLRWYQRRADGTLRDTVLFSVVAAEWPVVRAGLVARVAASPGAEVCERRPDG